jgi:hypothetical protein
MSEYDTGKLKIGDRVIVEGKLGTVINPHELEFFDPKTGGFRKKFHGADIKLFDEFCARYFQAKNITIEINTTTP